MSQCTWPVARECLPEVTADEDIARLQSAVDTAVLVLWSFTGRRFGCCPRRIRPCPGEHVGLSGWWGAWLYRGVELGGIDSWEQIACECGPRCQASGPGVVHLPGPVCSVTEVTVDGAVIDSGLYTLEGDRLYHNGGRWPDQNLQLPAGSPGTWTVDYLQGEAPPAGADQMVGLLALEFWNACTGGKCRLPRRVESLTRQGVSMRMADPGVLFANFQTGITEIDMWVAAVNPHKLSAPAAVSSPDYPHRGA